jgi:mono/diheme cytochrome c family protein
MHRIPASAAKRWFVTGDVERSGKGHGRNKLGRCLVIWLLVMGSTPLPAAEEPPAADNRAADDGAADNRAAEDFFERHVRPVLLARCVSCHGDRKQEGGLRVDSREALLQGGDRGPALVPGDLASSLLWQAMERKGDLAMPPTGPLPATELAAVRTWIVAGDLAQHGNATSSGFAATRPEGSLGLSTAAASRTAAQRTVTYGTLHVGPNSGRCVHSAKACRTEPAARSAGRSPHADPPLDPCVDWFATTTRQGRPVRLRSRSASV